MKKTQKTSWTRAAELFNFVHGMYPGVAQRQGNSWKGWLKLGKFVLRLEEKFNANKTKKPSQP